MSVTYVFSQYNLVFTNADQPLTLSSDLILMANASGVSDDSRMTATCDWDWIIDGNYGSGDTSKSYIIRMTGANPVLTVGGDYTGASSKKYNLSITSTENRFETAAVRANQSLQLLLTSQAGAYMADGNVDANITVNSQNTINRAGEMYKDAKAASNQATALGFDVVGTLTLLSDLIGNIKVNLDAKLQGIKVQSGDDYTANNTSTNQDADAIGIRSANLVLNRNFNAVVKADDTATITGFGSLTVSSNTVAAKGLRVLGDLSASDGAWSCSVSNYKITESGDWRSSSGEWNGTITATLHDSKLGAAKAYVDTAKVTEYGTATVSGNDFSAYGIWADGDITIDHLKGKAGTEISATAADNIVDVRATSEGETASITLSGNTFNVYGIKGGNVTLKRVDSTFDIAAKMDNVNVAGSLTASKNRNLTLSGNKLYAVGIDAADTLTLGSFNGKVTTTVTDSGITVANYKLDDLKDDTLYRAYGIRAKNIYAADNLGGVITVTTTDFTGVSDSLPSEATLEVSGIYAETAFCVTGRINSTINVTMNGSDHYSSNPLGYGIRASGIFADAFSGTINMSAPLDTDNVVKSVGILAGAFSTTSPVIFPNGTVAADAFDINGTVTSTIAGVITTAALNLRVSGNITGKGFNGYGFKYLVQDGIAIETDGRNATSKNNDQIELASTAVVKGDINMYGGENSLVLNSGAQFTGKLLADGGEMDIRFDLDKTIRTNAIVTVDVYEDRNGEYDHPLTGETKYFYDSRDISLISTSHITVNLNNAVDGKTYKLFQYKSFQTEADNAWLSGAKGIAFSYQGQSLTRTVTGGTASATFTDADGNEVTATLTYSDYTVSVTVTNNCTLAAFTGELTTTVDADNKQVTLGWEKQTFEVPGIYEVEYKIDGAKTIAVKTSEFSTTINGFDAGASIQWRVRRNTANGTVVSDWSAWTTDSAAPAPTPDAPDMTASNPTAVDPGGSTTMTGARARLFWTDAVAGSEIIRYEVEGIAASTKLASTRLAEIYADPSIATTDPDITFFTKTTTAPEILASQLPNRTFVYWRVRAVDAYGQYSDYVDGNMFRVFLGDDNPPAWDADTEMAATAVVIYNTVDRDNPTGEVTLTWPKAEDLLGSGIRRYRIDYRLSGASDWQSVYADESNYLESDSAVRSGTITGLASGAYEYRIYAQDYVGNVSFMFIPGAVAVGDVTKPEWNDAEASTADSIVVAYDVTTDPDKPVTDATFTFGAAADVDEAIVYKRDSSGNFVYEKDEFGNVRVDADGNPIKIPIYTNHASGVKEYVIEYWTGSAAHKSITVAETGAASYTCTLANITRSKSYSYTITAYDFYGNATASLGESTITLGDFTAPMWQDDGVSASVAYDVSGTYPKTAVTIDFGYAEDVDTSDTPDGHLTNPGSGVKEYVVKYWTSDYEYDIQTETVTATGATAYTWNRTLDGGSRIFKYEIYARDFYGNEKLGASGARIGDFTAPEWVDDTITVSASYDLTDPDAPKMIADFAWGYAQDPSHTDDTGFVDPGSGVKEYVLKYRTSTDASVPLETVTIANTGATGYSTSVTLPDAGRIYSYGVYARDYYGNETGIVAESVDMGDFTAPEWRDETVTVGVEYTALTGAGAPKMTATFNWGWAEDVTTDPVTNPASGVKTYVLKYWTSEKDADMYTVTVADTGATAYTQDVSLTDGGRIYKYEITAVDYYGNTSVALTGSDIGDFTAPEWVDDTVAITVAYDVSLPNSPKTGVTFEWGYAEDVAPEVEGVTNSATGVKEYVLKYWFGTDDTWSVTLANDGSTSYSYTVGNIVPNRRYSYSIAAVDYYGNSTALTGSNVTFGDFTAPQKLDVGFNAEVYYDVVSDPASPTVGVTFSWSGTEDTDTSAGIITNPGSGVKEYVLSFGAYDDVVFADNGAATYTHTFADVANGDYNFSVYAVDFYGNRVLLAGDKIRVDKDTVAPEWVDDTVTVDLSYDVSDADDPKLDAAFNWGYASDRVSDSDIVYTSGVKEYVLKYWTSASDVQTVTVASTGAENYTYVVEDIAPNKSYSYSVTAVDFFGNEAVISGKGLVIGDFTRPKWQDDSFTLVVDYNTTDPADVFTDVTFNWGYAEDPDTSDAVVSNPGSGVKEYVLKYWTSTADLQTVTIANDGSTSFSYTVTGIAPSQSYSYSVAAVDYYGNENKLSASSVIGDFTAPVWQDSDVAIDVLYDTATDPDAPVTTAVFKWGYAEDADTSTATVTNLGSGVKEYVLKYWTTTEDVRTVTIAATGATSYSYMAEDIAPGDNYSYSIAAVDFYGNSKAIGASGIAIGDFTAPEWQDEEVAIAVGYDVTDPDAPKTGATFTWGWAEDVDTSEGGITNPGSGVKEYVLKYWTTAEDVQSVTVASVAGAKNYSYTLEDIVPGDNYSYLIAAVDYYGNSSEIGASGITIGDFAAPEWQDEEVLIDIAYDVTGASPKTDATFYWGYAEDVDTSEGSITNPGSGVKEYVLKIWTSASDARSVTVAATGVETYSCALADIVPGDNYSYSITAFDYYGNSSEIGAGNIVLGDYTAPEWQDETVDIAVAYDVTDPDAPKTAATFTWGYAEDVDGSSEGITNKGSGVKEYVLTYWTSTSDVQSVTVASTGEKSYTYTLESIAPSASYSYSIAAVDYYGNETEIGASNIALGDFTAPEWQDETVDIAVAYDVTGASPKTSATFTWGYAEDVDASVAGIENPGSGVKEYVFKYWTTAEDVQSVTVANTGAKSYTCTLEDIAASQSYSYSIAAVDYFGNESTISGSGIAIGDFTAPEWKDTAVTVSSSYDVSGASPRTDATFTWGYAEDVDASAAGIENPGSGVKEYVLKYWTTAENVQTVTVANTGATSYTYTATGVAPSQNYSYSITAVDYCGNVSDELAASGITIGDFVSPVWQSDQVTVKESLDRYEAFNVKLNADFAWTAASDDGGSGVKNYVLQYKLSTEDWSASRSVTVSGTTASVTGVPYSLYDYRIQGFDYYGNATTYLEGTFGSTDDVTPPTGRFDLSSFAVSVIGEWTEITTFVPDPTDWVGENNIGKATTVNELTGLTVTVSWQDSFVDDSGIVYTVEFANSADFLGRTYSFTQPRDTTVATQSLTLGNSLGNSVAVLAGMEKVYYRISVADGLGNVNPLTSAVQSFEMKDSLTGESVVFDSEVEAPTGLRAYSTRTAAGKSRLHFSWYDGGSLFGVNSYTLHVTVGGKTSTYTGITDTEYTLTDQIDGTYTWSVVANSGSGATASTSGSSLVVDATSPVFPTGASVSATSSYRDFALTWDAATDENGIQGYVVRYGAGRDTSKWVTGTATTNSYTGSITADGTYNYSITAVDKYGNTSAGSLSGSFTVSSSNSHDTAAKALPIKVTTLDETPSIHKGTVGLSGTAEWLKFTVASNNTDVYISLGNVGSSYKSGKGITVKGYSAADLKNAMFSTSVSTGASALQIRCDKAGTYYLAVTPKKKKAIMDYSVSVATDTPTAAVLKQGDNTWNGYDSAAGKHISAAGYQGEFRISMPAGSAGGNVSGTLLSDYVGASDPSDFRRLDVTTAGSFKFTLKGEASPLNLTVYSVKYNYVGDVVGVKALKTLKLNPKYDKASAKWVATISTKDLMLVSGSYYIGVTAPNASKNQNSIYTVSVKGTLFTKGNNADDNWNTLGDAYSKVIPAGATATSLTLFADEWVGFGDSVDYRKLTVNQAGSYDFTVSGVNTPLTMTVYAQNSSGDLSKVKSVSVKQGSGRISGLQTDVGTYYVEVKAKNTNSGKNTNYQVQVTGMGFTKTNNADDSWTNLPAEYTISGTTSFTDWVGFGDAIDYRKIDVAANGGMYTFRLSGMSNKVKLSVYSVNDGNLELVKSVTGSSGNSSLLLKDLCLSAGTRYYLAVEAPGAQKAQNTAYTLAMTEEGTFDHRNNNSWAGATLATGSEFEFNGMLTMSSGGDDVDFINLQNGDFDTLALDMKTGKTKLSFFDRDHNAVKATSVTFKDGSSQINVASVTLVADNPTTDSIRLSDLDDAIKYLRIDAASTGADSYLLKLA